ncbi:thiamine phosphate synthase [Microbulbifer thermotolerans]|uniref:thiamine phosphate synthase n=1 Tax=Microbulbifer thermotolerans TaxID=252514 RepID=UPI00224AB2D2|nr:thiamine phosphate synthase [Microbulbifer thermotolerans]MCX2843068.1 thiamine phosphate synthase [Microbulbifer thermotolerans]
MRATSPGQKPIVWSIAGSDSGGGAGIQADLLTFADMGCHGCTAITANTAQNTLEVAAVNAVAPEVLVSQLDALRRDLFPAAIKIGLLANVEQVILVAEFLRALLKVKQIPVVYDPVAVASSGGTLTEGNIGEAVVDHLLPLCDLVTPNLHELEWLVRAAANDAGERVKAARRLCDRGCGAVLVTGGHRELVHGEVADLLWDGNDVDWFIGKKIANNNNHGTGCTLSSAIAACLARGYPLRDACVVAKAYVQRGLRLGSAGTGSGIAPVGHCGWPSELRDYPEILLPTESRAAAYAYTDNSWQGAFVQGFATPDTTALGLYPVVDSVAWLEKLAALGVRTLQLRIKNPDENLREQVQRAVAIGKKYQLRLFINDYWQLAIDCDAYGVHLGQEDLRCADLAAIKAAGLKLGISTHGFYELLLAYRYRPSYLAIGAIYATDTKDMGGQLQGTEKLARMAELLPEYPLVAIGGINRARAPEVLATGVGSIAVVSAVTKADDYRRAVEQFQTLMGPCIC